MLYPAQTTSISTDVVLTSRRGTCVRFHFRVLVGSPVGRKRAVENHRAMLTKLMRTGTSISGPMTAANACPEPMPKTATATAIASSKLLLAAVNARAAVLV